MMKHEITLTLAVFAAGFCLASVEVVACEALGYKKNWRRLAAARATSNANEHSQADTQNSIDAFRVVRPGAAGSGDAMKTPFLP